jgi:aryl-alcohol dehydrogenase-like predicted oxidoreductase
MKTRLLGTTELEVPILAFGASSLGAEFRSITFDEATGSVRAALDAGLRLIDTSPFYGRGMSEVLLGIALAGVPRRDYLLCTKLGRYDLGHFDFSARRVAESISTSCSATTSSSCRCGRSSTRRCRPSRRCGSQVR